MHPMMEGGWAGATASWWLLFLAAAVVSFALGVVVGYAWDDGAGPTRPYRRSPEEILRERYARGQLTRERYLEALIDLLKDRYVRGELDLEAYEERLGILLDGSAAPKSCTRCSASRA